MTKTVPVIYRLVTLCLLLALWQPAHAQNADIDMLRDVHMHRNKNMDGTMRTISDLNFPVAAAIPVTELVTGYLRHDTALFINGLQTAAGYVITGIITYGMKYAINRPRPVATYPYLQPYEMYTDHSFPSGHTSLAFSAATSLSLCYPKWYVIAPSYLWASSVGYSRMHLGVHYPSDVLVGAIVGTGSSWLAYKGTKWLKGRRKR